MTEHADGNRRHTVDRLHRFSDVASTSRIEFLKLIEQTLDALGAWRREIETLIDNGEMLTESIQGNPMTVPYDANGELERKLEGIEAGIREEALPTLASKRDAALKDPALRGEYEDGIVSAYEELISLMKKLHDTTVNLRWAVIEHDADLEGPTGDALNAPDDLVRSIVG